jgi:hypothetical protein
LGFTKEDLLKKHNIVVWLGKKTIFLKQFSIYII